MKTTHYLLFLCLACILGACTTQATTVPTDIPTLATPIQEATAPTPEVFIALTQAAPVQVQFNGTQLAVQEARVGTCDLPDCPAAQAGRRYLRVTLQALNLPADQSLEYKDLPQGIAVYDDTGTSTPWERLAAYVPADQQLILYFTVPTAATAFDLQWPEITAIPLTVTIDPTPTEQPAAFSGTEISYGPLTLVVPPGVADGASGNEVLPVTSEDAAWWEKTPGHTLVDLSDYYVLQGTSRQPVILVYPAQAFAELLPVAFESMHRLNNILYDPNAAMMPEGLPAVPFFNEQQVFAAHIQVVPFQNGRGVRFLTEYAQYAVSANNADLFYEFQGLSADGAYYIVAILPIRMPLLAETSDGGAALPPGGIPYTYFAEGGNFDAQDYYARVTDLLNTASPESFSPTIGQLDALIQSMEVGP